MQGFCLRDFRGGKSTPTLYDRVHCCLWGIVKPETHKGLNSTPYEFLVKLNDSKLNLHR